MISARKGASGGESGFDAGMIRDSKGLIGWAEQRYQAEGSLSCRSRRPSTACAFLPIGRNFCRISRHFPDRDGSERRCRAGQM